MSACDRGGSQGTTAQGEAPVTVVEAAPVVAAPVVVAPPAATPSVVTPPVVAPVPVVVAPGRVVELGVAPPPPGVEETFAAMSTRYAAVAPASKDPNNDGFKLYKVKAYAQALPLFAAASQRDATKWKYPFNMACAAALIGDEATTRVALREALRRDKEAVSRKSESDEDLTEMRTKAWFAPVVRGEPWPPAGGPPVGAVAPEVPPVVAGSEAPRVAAEVPPVAPPVASEVPPMASEAPPVADVPPVVVAAVVAEPEVPAPVVAPAPELPRGVVAAMGKPDLEALKVKLGELHKVKVKIRGSLAHETTAGVPLGFAVYEMSRFDACVAAKGTEPKAAKRACRSELRGDEEQGEGSQLLCTDQYYIKVTRFAPIEVGAPVEFTAGCSLKVQRMAAYDYDADGWDEVLVDVVGKESIPEFRTAGEDVYQRNLLMLRLDGTVQLYVTYLWTDMVDTMSGRARRIGVRDDTGDGKLDLIVSSRDFQVEPGMPTAEALWPVEDEEDGAAQLGEVSTEMWAYDAVKDEWAESPRAKKGK